MSLPHRVYAMNKTVLKVRIDEVALHVNPQTNGFYSSEHGMRHLVPWERRTFSRCGPEDSVS